MNILGIDPGTEKSAYCLLLDGTISEFRIVPNDQMFFILRSPEREVDVAIEMVASYGMPVGKEVFETVKWIGKFEYVFELCGLKVREVFRKDIKIHFCQSMKAKDSNIRQALLDRYGKEATKGIHKDMWSALAIATYVHDLKGG